jgi:hypothetical protein
MAARSYTLERMELAQWVVPRAATLTERRFNRPERIFQRKYDLSFRQRCVRFEF